MGWEWKPWECTHYAPDRFLKSSWESDVKATFMNGLALFCRVYLLFCVCITCWSLWVCVYILHILHLSHTHFQCQSRLKWILKLSVTLPVGWIHYTLASQHNHCQAWACQLPSRVSWSRCVWRMQVKLTECRLLGLREGVSKQSPSIFVMLSTLSSLSSWHARCRGGILLL